LTGHFSTTAREIAKPNSQKREQLKLTAFGFLTYGESQRKRGSAAVCLKGDLMESSRRELLKASVSAATLIAAPALMTRTVLGADVPIVVGGLYDQSGPLGTSGVLMVNALAFAIDRLNDEGGLLGKKLKPRDHHGMGPAISRVEFRAAQHFDDEMRDVLGMPRIHAREDGAKQRIARCLGIEGARENREHFRTSSPFAECGRCVGRAHRTHSVPVGR
jgi:hypothetical protein